MGHSGANLTPEQWAQTVLEIVAESGASGVRLTRVARFVGFRATVVQREFSSRWELLEVALSVLQNRVRIDAINPSEQKLDPEAALRSLVVAPITILRETPGMSRLLFSEDALSKNPERQEQVLEIMRGYFGQVAAIVVAGQREGRIRVDIDDPSAVALLLMGIVQPAAILSQLSDGHFDAAEHLDSVWSLVRDAVIERESSNEESQRTKTNGRK